MGYPRILYLNRIASATITLSGGTTTTGYPLNNMKDWRDYYRWAASGANSYVLKADYGSEVSAQSVALSGHNLYTCGARWKLDGSDNDADWTALQAYVTASDNKTVARFFASDSYRYYRLTVDNNGGANFSPEIGVWFVGNYIEFPQLLTFPFDPDSHKIRSSRAQGDTGRPLGCAVDFRERMVMATFNHLTPSWVSATWQPFWNSYFSQPFVWCWDYANYASAAYLMEWDMDTMSAPFDGAFRNPLTLNMRGLLEE